MDKEYFVECRHHDAMFYKHDNKYRLWLNENIGRSNWQFHGGGSEHPNTIRFENGADALAFKLKFGL